MGCAAASSWLLGGERGTGEPSSWSTLLLRGKQSSRWLSGCFMPVVVQRPVLGGFSAEHESLFMRQSTVASGRISCISCTRSSHTWKYGVLFHPGFVSGSHCVGVWVLLAEFRELDFSGDVPILWGATLGSTVVTCSASVQDASGRNSHISGEFSEPDSEGAVFELAGWPLTGPLPSCFKNTEKFHVRWGRFPDQA